MTQDQPDARQLLANVQLQLSQLNKQLLRTRQAVAALQAEAALRREDREPVMPIEFTSQFGEDLLVWTLLAGQTTGFFVEAGAFDGYHHSVTYAFEAVGWRGLLVEPIPARAAACAVRRPNSRVVHAALSRRGSTGATDFWVVDDPHGGILSYAKPTPDHLAAIGNVPRTRVSVPLATLDDLLAAHGDPVDLCVIDVEGAEPDVLDGFDLARFRPRLMLIEDNARGADPAVRDLMARHPYTRAGRLAVNDLYIRNDQPDVFDRFKWLQIG